MTVRFPARVMGVAREASWVCDLHDLELRRAQCLFYALLSLLLMLFY